MRERRVEEHSCVHYQTYLDVTMHNMVALQVNERRTQLHHQQ